MIKFDTNIPCEFAKKLEFLKKINTFSSKAT